MSQEQYIYAVARVRSKELALLDKSVLEQLLSCKTYEDCLKILSDKGWGDHNGESAEEILSQEREKTWSFIRELVGDMSVFDTFLYEKDFHNLKAAIKQVYIRNEVPNIFINDGTVDANQIYEAVKNHDFSILPEHMQVPAEEAYQVQMRNGDGQLCDVILDRAALDTIYKMAAASENELLMEYAELRIVTANLNSSIRGAKTGKRIEFFEMALAQCKTLNKKELIRASLMGVEAIYDYLETTVYDDAVKALKESFSSFERWCDNLIINRIKPQKFNTTSVSPLAAYILARENEIKTVRILLSGKLNDLPENSIRERLRDMYV